MSASDGGLTSARGVGGGLDGSHYSGAKARGGETHDELKPR